MHVVLISLLAACTFEPDENFVKKSKDPKATLDAGKLHNIDLMNLPDTFPVLTPTMVLFYDLQLSQEIKYVEVTVFVDDETVIWESSDPKENFTLRTEDYEDGFHSIHMVAKSNTGTGSLADKNGEEQLSWEFNWTFSVNRFQPSPTKITDVYADNGQLTIEWEASDELTAKQIDVEYKDKYGFTDASWSYIINDPYQTKIVDSNFIDGDVNVRLTNIAIDPAYPSPKNTKAISFAPPKIISSSVDEYGKLTVTWNKSLFYKNIDRYEIKLGDEVIFSGLDTTFTTDKYYFGYYRAISVRTISKYVDPFYPIVSEGTVSVPIGEPIPNLIAELIHSPLEPQLGFNYYYSKKRVDVMYKDSVVYTSPASISIASMTVSNHGEYLYYTTGFKIMRMDRSGNIETVCDTESLYALKGFISDLSIGADRYLCFNNRDSKLPTIDAYMYDLVDQKLIFKRTGPIYNYLDTDTRQTPDGKYVVLSSSYKIEVLTMEDGAIVNTKTLDPIYDAVFFNTAVDNNLILFNSNQVAIYNPVTDVLETKKIVHSTTQYVAERINYDPVTGYICYGQSHRTLVVDPIKALEVRSIYTYGTEWGQLYNGFLYLRYAKMKLNLRLP
jgi:hypothetical protein